nr:SHOCT domain-containing protein [Actinokineospora fastidiosa]
MTVVLVVVAVMTAVLIRHFGTGSSARRILDERFARGEIDAEEYADRRARLGR